MGDSSPLWKAQKSVIGLNCLRSGVLYSPGCELRDAWEIAPAERTVCSVLHGALTHDSHVLVDDRYVLRNVSLGDFIIVGTSLTLN